MPSVSQEIQVQRLKDAISSEHLAREVAWPQAVRRFPRRPLSTCRREWNIWECTENAKVAPRPLPGRSTARYWAVQASKQSQSMHFQYTRSIHLWTSPTSTQLQITSMHMQPTSSSVNCFLPPEFARPPSLSTISKSFTTQNFVLTTY